MSQYHSRLERQGAVVGAALALQGAVVIPAFRGGAGTFPGRGEGFLGPWKMAGALQWSCPPDSTPPEEGPGQPRRPENPEATEP